MSFSSRWVEAPAGVTEREGLAAGFRAAGVRAGINPSGDPDLALLVSDLCLHGILQRPSDSP